MIVLLWRWWLFLFKLSFHCLLFACCCYSNFTIYVLVGFSFPICQDYIELFLQMLSVNFKKIFSKEMIVKKYFLKKWYFNIFCPKTVFTRAKVLSEWRNNYDFIKTVICGDYVLTVRTAEEQKVLVHLKTIKNSTKHSQLTATDSSSSFVMICRFPIMIWWWENCENTKNQRWWEAE